MLLGIVRSMKVPQCCPIARRIRGCKLSVGQANRVTASPPMIELSRDIPQHLVVSG